MTTSHITCSGCGAALQVLPPEQVVSYLRGKGWEEPQKPSATYAAFRRNLDWLDVPMLDIHFAYPQRFAEMLGNLARIESRPAAVIVEEMRGMR